MHTLCNDYGKIWNNAIDGGVKYFQAYPNLKSCIIGLSGGIDSALSAVLARAVCDKLERTGRIISLYGYSIPILTNEKDELSRASSAGFGHCHHFTEVTGDKAVMDLIRPIDNSLHYAFFVDKNDKDLPHDVKIRIGNIKARYRMMYLYDKAYKNKGIVLSTDNYTEYLLGFWTLHGDVGDFGFMQELWKTEIYGLAKWKGQMVSDGVLLETVDAKPTDGLGVSDSDLSQLLPGWTGSYRAGYEFIDKLLIAYVDGDSYISAGGDTFQVDMLMNHAVLKRHFATEFKRTNPFNLERKDLIT